MTPTKFMYDKCISILSETTPELPQEEALTEQIMLRIRQQSRSETPAMLLWVRTFSGIAASLLIAVFIWQHPVEMNENKQLSYYEKKVSSLENLPCIKTGADEIRDIKDLYSCYRQNSNKTSKFKSLINK